jgi:calcineurin-like phosphoesterase
MGNIYMKKCEDVFPYIEKEIKKIRLKKEVDFLAIDFHAEITSEKQAMAHFLDGQATFIVGTHTHTPTLDYRILENGTAFQTDAGMCGDYNSVIGMNKENAILKFFKKKTERLIPVTKNATISGIKVVADPETGLAKDIHPVMVGGNLKYNN